MRGLARARGMHMDLADGHLPFFDDFDWNANRLVSTVVTALPVTHLPVLGTTVPGLWVPVPVVHQQIFNIQMPGGAAPGQGVGCVERHSDSMQREAIRLPPSVAVG